MNPIRLFGVVMAIVGAFFALGEPLVSAIKGVSPDGGFITGGTVLFLVGVLFVILTMLGLRPLPVIIDCLDCGRMFTVKSEAEKHREFTRHHLAARPSRVFGRRF